MRRVKSHTFDGVKYEIDVEEPFDGLCESPLSQDRKPAIRVPVSINSRYGIQCLIHECLHACSWLKSEERVDQVATEIGALLWRLGFRRKVKE